MSKIAVIEDDREASDTFAGWLKKARPRDQVDQLHDRDAAVAALRSTRYDLITLDIQLATDREAGTEAGISLIRPIIETKQGLVIVISGQEPDKYRSIVTSLDMWDYLVKPVSEDVFLALVQKAFRSIPSVGSAEGANISIVGELEIDPLHTTHPKWRGQRLSLPITGQRIVSALATNADKLVSYKHLFSLLPGSASKTNLRYHIKVIRDAFRVIEGSFNRIVHVPMGGYMWRSK